jgi:dolichyl-phosphate-mannose-protein mannosyltransferase
MCLKNQIRISIISILLVSVILRISGFFSAVFMDEVHILRAVSHYISNRTIIPPWFDWSPLFSYLAVPVTGLCSVLGGVFSGHSPSEWALIESAFIGKNLVIGIRGLSLFFSLITLSLLWRMGSEKKEVWPGICAVLLYMFSPICIRYDSYGLAESGLALSITCVIVFCLRYMRTQKARDIFLAGCFTGVAAAFKYNGALAAIPVAFAVLDFKKDYSKTFIRVIGAAFFSILAFLIFCPTWVFTFSKALEGFRFQTSNVTSQRIVPVIIPYLGTPFYLLKNEPGLLFAMILSIAALIKKPDRRKFVLLSLPFACFLIVGGWKRQDVNYWIPAIPALSILLPYSFRTLFPKMNMKYLCVTSALILFFALVIISPPLYSTDNYDRMSLWLSKNIKPDSIIIRDGGYTPKIWDLEAINDFKKGRGVNLSEKGEILFNKRLKNSPKAASVFTDIELLKKMKESGIEDFESVIPENAFFLSSDFTIERIQEAKEPDLPDLKFIYRIKRTFYKKLLDPDGPWEKIHEESRGSGYTRYIFRKKRRL